jgi:hypothetical protein
VAGERRFGALVLDGEPVRDDRLLLDRAAPALALALFAEQASAEAARRTRAALLVDLLTTTSERPAVRQAGLDPSARYSVLVVASGRARLPQLPGVLGEGWHSPQRALELHMLLHLTAPCATPCSRPRACPWNGLALAHAQDQGDRVLRGDCWSQNFLEEQATNRGDGDGGRGQRFLGVEPFAFRE